MELGHKCAAESSVGDEGYDEINQWPLAIGLQEQVANHRKRLGSKAPVVSVAEKASSDVRCESKKANNRELPFNCRNN